MDGIEMTIKQSPSLWSLGHMKSTTKYEPCCFSDLP